MLPTQLLGPSSHWHGTGVGEELEAGYQLLLLALWIQGKTAFAQCMGSGIIKLASQEQKDYIKKETGTRTSPYKAKQSCFFRAKSFA